jgi:disulfide bond formation protein DsbB
MTLFSNRKKLYLIVLILSLISIMSALYIEFILGYKPCRLCIYQRLPYLAAVFMSFIGLFYIKNENILIILIIIFTFSTLISGYHFGIENSFFEEFSSCTNHQLNLSEKEKLLESLSKIMPVDCKDATFKILGVSLAAINALLSILIVIISIQTLSYEKN